jgi:hypothetical protein
VTAESPLKTRFPLTVYLLRCQWDDLSGREGRQWSDMITALISGGESDCVKPTIRDMQRQLWLFAEDPI